MAFLERLPQHLEDVAAELEHLVEEQDAMVREAHLAGTRVRAAADERGVGDGVVRRAEGPLPDHGLSLVKQSQYGVDLRHFQRFLKTQPGQNSRKPACEHGLARTRRAAH